MTHLATIVPALLFLVVALAAPPDSPFTWFGLILAILVSLDVMRAFTGAKSSPLVRWLVGLQIGGWVLLSANGTWASSVAHSVRTAHWPVGEFSSLSAGQMIALAVPLAVVGVLALVVAIKSSLLSRQADQDRWGQVSMLANRGRRPTPLTWSTARVLGPGPVVALLSRWLASHALRSVVNVPGQVAFIYTLSVWCSVTIMVVVAGIPMADIASQLVGAGRLWDSIIGIIVIWASGTWGGRVMSAAHQAQGSVGKMAFAWPCLVVLWLGPQTSAAVAAEYTTFGGALYDAIPLSTAVMFGVILWAMAFAWQSDTRAAQSTRMALWVAALAIASWRLLHADEAAGWVLYSSGIVVLAWTAALALADYAPRADGVAGFNLRATYPQLLRTVLTAGGVAVLGTIMVALLANVSAVTAPAAALAHLVLVAVAIVGVFVPLFAVVNYALYARRMMARIRGGRETQP